MNTTTNNNSTEAKELNKKAPKESKPKKEKKAKEQKDKSFKFPDAINVTQNSYDGSGRIWDNVLEYIVRENNTDKSFANYKDANEYASKNNLNVLVLIEQLAGHYIIEDKNSISIAQERRTTIWKADELINTHYSPSRLRAELGKAAKDLVKGVKG
jgi:hypothetical protein